MVLQVTADLTSGSMVLTYGSNRQKGKILQMPKAVT